MNSFFRAIRTFALVVFALTLFAGTSTFAQTFRGTILGSVTDSSGAAVPGATVTIKNVDTGLVRTVSTSDDGSYSAPELPIGTYSVSVEKAGFKLGVVTGIKVEVSSERRADVALQIGQAAQSVEVRGEELPMVKCTSSPSSKLNTAAAPARRSISLRRAVPTRFMARHSIISAIRP